MWMPSSNMPAQARVMHWSGTVPTQSTTSEERSLLVWDSTHPVYHICATTALQLTWNPFTESIGFE